MSTQLRVLSWNIHDGLLRPGQNNDLVAAIQTEKKPDIVILLEYNVSGTKDNRANTTVDNVVRSEGYGRPLRWCLTRRKKKGRSSIRVGAAFPRLDRVSKISPVVGARYYQGHVILKVELIGATTPLYLAMVHNHHKGDVPRLITMLDLWQNPIYQPCIAIGDFNRLCDTSEWIAPELTSIQSAWAPPTPNCVNIKGGVPATSCVSTHNYSQPAGRRIDYPLRAPLSSIRIVALRHLTDVTGSDHIPIVADFEIP